jgi:hypothetical protein
MGSVLPRIAVALTFGLLLTGMARAQATINDCESIQAADAYNQCLAKFGPSSKQNNLEPERAADVKNSSEDAAASAGRAHGRAARRGASHGRYRGGGGRHRLVIRVGRHRHR